MDRNLKTLSLFGAPIHYPKQLGDLVVKQRKDKVQQEKSLMPLAEELVKKICHPLTEEKETILLNAYQKVSPQVYFDIFQTGDLQSSVKKLQNITIPILILSGSEDEIYPPELFSASLNFNPGARYYTVPQASFLIQMDQPKLTADWLIQFIAKARGTSMPNLDYQKNLTSTMYTEIRELLQQGHSPNELRVSIMKGFHVELNGKAIYEGWGKRKAKQILVYLVFKKSVTRDQLCDQFWPNVDLENTRNRLRVSIHYLKQLLEKNAGEGGSSVLVTDREHVFLQGRIQCDLLDYLQAMKEAHLLEDPMEKSEKYQRLLIDCVDEFPGLYEEWFLELQQWLETSWGEMALYLVQWYKKQQDNHHAAYYSEVAEKFLPIIGSNLHE